MIVLSHSKAFLCGLWDSTVRNSPAAVRIDRAQSGSELSAWDVRADSISEHDKRHELARHYLRAADPSKEREVAASIRPILEAYMRVACPEHFRPGALLGPFLSICEQRASAGEQIMSAEDVSELRKLLDYANQFHHDTNAAYMTTAISDTELRQFLERALTFAS